MRPQLNGEKKHLADVLLALQGHALGSVNTRREYEWKLSIAVWTASAILLGSMLTGQIKLLDTYPKVGLTCLAVCIVLLHLAWMKGAGRRNRADIRAACFWEEQTRALLDASYPEELTHEFSNLRASSGRLHTYSYLFQLSVTILLAVAVILKAWV